MIAILLVALGLSMDAFAVSVSSGIGIRNLRFFHAARASFFFGFFQFVMPLAGAFLGGAFMVYIEAFDHWIAFGLLVFIGGKMLLDALRRGALSPREAVACMRRDGPKVRHTPPQSDDIKGINPEDLYLTNTTYPAEPSDRARRARTADGLADIRSLKTLLVLSVATSIDALAAGISLRIMGHGILSGAGIIGGVTFTVCLCGFEFGRRAGFVLEKWAQTAGGIMLIGIGVKILIQHLAGI
jgi:putative Mn2+ efflux pump MntP